MPNLNVDLNFPDHPKTKRLAALIGRDPEAMLLRIWCYCGKYHTDSGRLEGLSAQEVEALAGWRGKPGAMCEAMTRTKWLEMDGGTYVVHDWREHQGHLQAYKERGKMMANRRWGRPPDAASNACSNAASIASSNAPAVPANQPVHPPPPNARAQEVSDVPDKAQAITQAGLQAIDAEFAGYVFDDWSSRDGRDSAGNPVQWIRYIVKRWNRERTEWQAGTHKGRKTATRRPEANMVQENLKVREL